MVFQCFNEGVDVFREFGDRCNTKRYCSRFRQRASSWLWYRSAGSQTTETFGAELASPLCECWQLEIGRCAHSLFVGSGNRVPTIPDICIHEQTAFVWAHSVVSQYSRLLRCDISPLYVSFLGTMKFKRQNLTCWQPCVCFGWTKGPSKMQRNRKPSQSSRHHTRCTH